MKSLSLEQLLEIENQTVILPYTDFAAICKSNLSIFQFMHLLIDAKYRQDPLNKLYKEYRTHGLIYQTIEELYLSLLDDLIAVINRTAVEKDPLSLSILLGDYLIPSGLLSYSTKFHYIDSRKLVCMDDDYIFFHSNYGKLIFCGYGVCRHIVSFVSDILNRMGIINDKIPCHSLEVENIVPSLMRNANPNHLILGYPYKNHYYLADITNHIYNLSIENEYIEKGWKEKLVLNYTKTYLFQESLSWSLDIPYGSFSKEEVMKRKKKVELCLLAGDREKFIEFKRNHLDMLEKIAYLLPIEMNRNIEKEQEKQRKKKIQI